MKIILRFLILSLMVILITSLVSAQCVPDGDSCGEETNPCCSGPLNCNEDYSSGTFCVSDSSSCIHAGIEYTNQEPGPECFDFGANGIPGEQLTCNDGTWSQYACGFTNSCSTNLCTQIKEANACQNGNPSTCLEGGAGLINTNAADEEYCLNGELFTCDATHPFSCISGTYIDDADLNRYICECAFDDIQSICNIDDEVGCWDAGESKCCGDDLLEDNWIGINGFCNEGEWKIGSPPNIPFDLSQSPGAESSPTTNKNPSLFFNISSDDTKDIGYRIQIDNDAYFPSPLIDYQELRDGNGPYHINYTLPYYWELPDGLYYWRVLAYDEDGASSPWKEYATQAVVDFQVANIPENITHNPLDYSGCWGVTLCGENFTCGIYDDVCVNDFFTPSTEASCNKNFGDAYYNYFKCLDPDCDRGTCFYGVVNSLDSNNQPIENAVVTYEQDVSDGDKKVTLTNETISNASGQYRLDVHPGNGIFIMADAPGYAPTLAGPFYNVVSGCQEFNLTLANGTCQPDCTKQGSKYCSKTCQGEGSAAGLCEYGTNTTYDTGEGAGTITIIAPYKACTTIGIQKDSYAQLGNFSGDDGIDQCVKAKCCDGIPFHVPCPTTDNISINIKDAIKITKIAKNKGETFRIKLYYWD